MKLRNLFASALIIGLAGCSSTTMQKNYDDAKFAMKDDMEKFTGIIHEHQKYGNAAPSKKIVSACRIRQGGLTENDFKDFVYFNQKQAALCFKLLQKYQDPRFNNVGSQDYKAYKAFHGKVNFYRKYFF